MSYEPTIWKKGDKVTSTKLNKIENGIQGNDEEITVVKRDLNDKANIDGTYDGMTVGSAKQLLSEKYLLDEEPYQFRASGGDGSDRVEECIVGGSVGWNQLVQNGDFSSGTTGWDARGAVVSVSGNTAIVTTSSAGTERGLKVSDSSASQFTAVVGHKYLINAEVNSPITCELLCALSGRNGTKVPVTANTWTRCQALYESSITVGQVTLYIRQALSQGDVIQYKNVNCFDLTAMFGSTIADYIYSLEQATAGAGVAWFKKYFPEDYYPYSAPTLRHVEGVSAKEVVGFNQWDEEWELGIISNADGSPSADNAHIRTKNYIPVLPNTTYYNTGYTLAVFLYDANHAFIGNANVTVGTFTTGANTHYIKFYRTATTYNHDICISLSDPTKNGVYEPYRKNIYPLDSSLTLRGIPKLMDGKMYFDGDKYNADGTVERRYGIVDLGELDWDKQILSDSVHYNFRTAISDFKAIPDSEIASMICNKYGTVSALDITTSGYIKDKTISSRSSAIAGVRVYDSAYTDAATFKTAMSGVYLVYELATPTTEQATPYTALQLLDPNGTEEFVTTGIVPVGHYSKYLENLRSKIEGLPKDFSTLIAPTEKTYKATRNYTVGSLLIVDNILYKVTSAIANGGTITPNTNVTATTLAAVIAAL